MSHTNRTAYTAARDALLERVTTTLRDDERFVAAWLGGSFGRGEQSWHSDLDLHVVVAEAYSEQLCAQPWSGGARTTPERLEVFRQFGELAVIYDAHSNNHIGGTFTYVLYQETALNIDWMLFPEKLAYLEEPRLPLFQKVELPPQPEEVPPSLEECIERASTNTGFFWMIAASNSLSLLEDEDLLNYHQGLRWLENSLREVRSALQGKRAKWTSDSEIHLYPTLAEQLAATRKLCDEMEELMPQVLTLGGYVPNSPRAVVEKRLALM